MKVERMQQDRNGGNPNLMTGAESLVRTLLNGGIDVCFANPGTSEMSLVAALDQTRGVRCVLALFEGVVTGAADGYARMADKPAVTLLHCGPGLANGLANLHNAKRAHSMIVNIVGDHATYHQKFDAPLASDVEATARPYSHWVRTSRDVADVGQDVAAAIDAARAGPGQIATLVVPSDAAWSFGGVPASTRMALTAARSASFESIVAAAKVLRSGEPTMLLVGGRALRGHGAKLAGAIAAATGASLRAPMLNGRLERGLGRVRIEPIPFRLDHALEVLSGIRNVLLFGAKAPTAFFAYPNKPGRLTNNNTSVHLVADVEEDTVGALESLAAELGVSVDSALVIQPSVTGATTDQLTAENLGLVLGELLPENCIVVDEGITMSAALLAGTLHAAPHDWLQNTGGSIGIGLPLATGAALASPGRRVVCLQADGSAMYTMQALWTQARENLDVTSIILSNRTYAILFREFANISAATPGDSAHDLMELRRPEIDWVQVAQGHGVPASRVVNMSEFRLAFNKAIRSAGPNLIEAVVG